MKLTFAEQKQILVEAKKERTKKQDERFKQLYTTALPSKRRCMELASEKGASCWLNVLPIKEHGFALHKSAFRDSLAIRYDLPLKNIPSYCECGHNFSLSHSLSCPKGGFPAIRHNELRNYTAELLKEVCTNVCIEPHLQPLTGEQLRLHTSIKGDEARLDVAADGLWGGRFERAFLDIRVFNPRAQSNQGSLTQVYRMHEKEKMRAYQQRIAEIEHATFIPVVISCTGGMGRSAQALFKRIAALITDKEDVNHYSDILWNIRCRINFALLRSALICIRGARSKIQTQIYSTINHQVADASITRTD